MTQTLVTDLPLWSSCPFRKHVPEWIEIRKGLVGAQTVVVFFNPVQGQHILTLVDPVPDQVWDETLEQGEGFREYKERILEPIIENLSKRRVVN